MSFSAAKVAQAVPLRSNNKPVAFHPLRGSLSFLGSPHKLFRFNPIPIPIPSSKIAVPLTRRSAVVAVSHVTKVKKDKSSTNLHNRPGFVGTGKRFVSCSAAPLSCLWLGGAAAVVFSSKSRVFTALAAVVDEEAALEQGIDGGGGEGVEGSEEERQWKLPRATEVYVCNLPRSCDAQQLRHMFEPHGTILSAEICRNAETGESRGCAYVTMGSITSARNAVTALDGTDVGGREMRVRFSVEMNPQRRDLETMNTSPRRVIYYEAPHKLYVGNLARAVRPEDLRHLFSKFGIVASVRLLQDRKQGRTRVYAFLSFLSERERDAALTLHGTELCGRTLVVREGIEKGET